MRLKKVVIGKITKVELEHLESFGRREEALIDGLGFLRTKKVDFWKLLEKEHPFPKEANIRNKIKINKKTREIYYEEYR